MPIFSLIGVEADGSYIVTSTMKANLLKLVIQNTCKLKPEKRPQSLNT
jgi:hypothetical protein